MGVRLAHSSQSVAYVLKYCAGFENCCSADLIGYFKRNARDAVRGAAGKFEPRRRSFKRTKWQVRRWSSSFARTSA
ncbi:MAG TPA: hypothetical protein VKC66_29680, partial [Xanthobacteraceae bacterium]|nr:hypothetical protein [Xanthobacteraceae bacterium]